jgi:uncharacterized protein with PIN domain
MSVETALVELANALRMDGYDLLATETGAHEARVEVQATDAACPDCLIPRQLFADMVRDRLRTDAGGDWRVDVVYPADAS